MSHVAEGELHAWLDGALDQLGEDRAAQVREHLRGCAACQQALVAEEAVRARANEVLSLAAPRTGDAPPFEALLERARGEPAQPRQGLLTRAARLGWAASVVVALGAGWMARELGLHPRVEPGNPFAEEAVPAMVDERGEAERADATEATVVVQPLAAPPPMATTSAAAVEPETGSASLEGAIGSAPAEARASAVGSGASGAIAGVTQKAAQDVAVAEPALSLDERVDVAVERPAVVPAPAVAQVRPRAESVRVPAVAPAAPGRSAGSAASAPPAANAREANAPARREAPRQERVASSAVPEAAGSGLGIQRSRPATDVPELFQGRAELGVGSRSGGGLAVEADVEEGTDLTVPGLEVLRVEWTDVVPGQRGLRVLQRLATGDTLEIRLVRSGGAAADAVNDPLATLVGAVLEEGWNQVVRAHGDGWLVARARRPRDEIEALVATAGQFRR